MDKLQEAFEQEFAAKIQSLVTEALEQVDVGALVTNMVKEKLEGGDFQSYVNDTIKQHVRDVKISDQAIKNLETTGAETLRQHMPRVVQTISDRVDSVLSETVDNKLANLSFPEASIDPKLLDTSKLRLTKSIYLILQVENKERMLLVLWKLWNYQRLLRQFQNLPKKK